MSLFRAINALAFRISALAVCALLLSASAIPASAQTKTCQSSQLKPSYPEPPEGGLGHGAVVYQVTNQSQQTCTLSGVPTLRLFDPQNHELAIPICAGCTDYVFPARPARPVLLRPGGSAYFLMGFNEDNAATDAYRLAHIHVGLESFSKYINFDFGPFAIRDVLDVSTWTSGVYDQEKDEAAAKIESAPSSKFLTVGSEILHPETVTGAWEFLLPSGKTVGLSIELIAAIDGNATTFAGQHQIIQSINITTYLRTGDKTERTQWETSAPGDLSWSAIHLSLSSDKASGSKSLTLLHLNLQFDPSTSSWQGTIRDQHFSGVVHLKRPAHARPGPLVGVWRTSDDIAAAGCAHIAMGADGHLIVWGELPRLRGLERYASGVKPPLHANQIYGDFPGDYTAQQSGNHWQLTMTTSQPASQIFGKGGQTMDGVLSQNGATFSGTIKEFGEQSGEYAPSGQQPPQTFRWIRIPSDVCSDSLPGSASTP